MEGKKKAGAIQSDLKAVGILGSFVV